MEQVIQILKLADWFSAHELRQACDERLCTLLHGLSNRQQVSDSREEAASQALEAGVQHCLTKTGGCWRGRAGGAGGGCLRAGAPTAAAPSANKEAARERAGSRRPVTARRPSCPPSAFQPPNPARATPGPVRAVGWLLPWALQQLSRGEKECPGAAAAEQLSGELRSQQQTAWFQVWACPRVFVHGWMANAVGMRHASDDTRRVRALPTPCGAASVSPTPCQQSQLPAASPPFLRSPAGPCCGRAAPKLDPCRLPSPPAGSRGPPPSPPARLPYGR